MPSSKKKKIFPIEFRKFRLLKGNFYCFLLFSEYFTPNKIFSVIFTKNCKRQQREHFEQFHEYKNEIQKMFYHKIFLENGDFLVFED